MKTGDRVYFVGSQEHKGTISKKNIYSYRVDWDNGTILNDRLYYQEELAPLPEKEPIPYNVQLREEMSKTLEKILEKIAKLSQDHLSLDSEGSDLSYQLDKVKKKLAFTKNEIERLKREAQIVQQNIITSLMGG